MRCPLFKAWPAEEPSRSVVCKAVWVCSSCHEDHVSLSQYSYGVVAKLAFGRREALPRSAMACIAVAVTACGEEQQRIPLVSLL
jgi:hypothetical protein